MTLKSSKQKFEKNTNYSCTNAFVYKDIMLFSAVLNHKINTIDINIRAKVSQLKKYLSKLFCNPQIIEKNG